MEVPPWGGPIQEYTIWRNMVELRGFEGLKCTQHAATVTAGVLSSKIYHLSATGETASMHVTPCVNN